MGRTMPPRTAAAQPGLTAGSSPYASFRASSVALEAISRTAFGRSDGGVCVMMAQLLMKPWCGCAVVELKPASVLRLAPRTWGNRAGPQGGDR
jgi:hypothetical protein